MASLLPDGTLEKYSYPQHQSTDGIGAGLRYLLLLCKDDAALLSTTRPCEGLRPSAVQGQPEQR